MTGASAAPALLWFRQDLRMSDNPALAAALERRAPVIPVFIWAPEEEGAWPPGAASPRWLDQSLASLAAELETRGSRLIVRRGPTAATLRRLVAESGASAVMWNRRYEPAAVARDRELMSKLRESGLDAASFNGSLLFEPRSGTQYVHAAQRQAPRGEAAREQTGGLGHFMAQARRRKPGGVSTKSGNCIRSATEVWRKEPREGAICRLSAKRRASIKTGQQ